MKLLFAMVGGGGKLDVVKSTFNFIEENNLSSDIISVYDDKVIEGTDKNIVDIQFDNFSRRTLLMEAVYKGHFKICDYLLDGKKANLQLKDKF